MEMTTDGGAPERAPVSQTDGASPVDAGPDSTRLEESNEAGALDPVPSAAPRRPTWGERLRNPRWWRRELRSWVLMLLLIVAFSWALGALRAPGVSGPAPDFTLQSLGGEPVSLSSFRGQTVVLNFWATWCPPCRVELPAFARFARNNPDVVVLGLSVQSPPDELRSMVESEGLDYPILVVDEATATQYQVTSLPTTFVIDPEGQIRTAHAGIVLRPMLWWMTR